MALSLHFDMNFTATALQTLGQHTQKNNEPRGEPQLSWNKLKILIFAALED